MSFLAQLRKQYQPQNGVQLCYLLRPQNDQLQLSLRLGVVDQGKLRAAEQHYCLEPAHLHAPPSFLVEQDVTLLRMLLQLDNSWGEGSEGPIPLDHQCHFLQQILQTQRCFDWRYQPLGWGELFNSQPYWHLEADASQTLSWTLPPGSQFWFSQPPLLVQQGMSLCTNRGEIPEALGKIKSLPALEVDAFIAEHGHVWNEQQFPLPVALSMQLVPSICSVQLICRSDYCALNSAPGDWLVLRFVYQTALISWLQETPNTRSNWAWVEDKRVFNVAADLVLEQQWRLKIAEFLQRQLPDIFIELGPGLWQLSPQIALQNSMQASPNSKNKNYWRQLLIEQRDELEALGVSLIYTQGFRFAYSHIQQWDVEIDTQGERFNINAQTLVDGVTINLWELIAQLRLMQLHHSQTDIEIAFAGKIVLLPAALAGSLCDEFADGEFGGTGGPGFPNSQVYRLQTLLAALPEHTQWSGATVLLDQAANLHKDPALLQPQLAGLQAQLRPYQWLGVCWLQHLKNAEFNGLLADDMGLGKTLQTIAHLSVEKHLGGLNHPVLIVAPTSLLPNWANELARFAPHLSATIIHGAQRNLECLAADIYITSYALAVRDSDFWCAQSLSWLILDEAQAIKNPSTQVSRCLRQFNARHRLCLSGTPVENHLGELWSLMDFLQPGYLGSQAEFKQHYQKPIEQDGQVLRLQQLQRRVAPLMLRRTKNQVAQDLPAKTHIDQIIPLSSQQQNFYQQLREEGWQQLQTQLEQSEHSGEQQILVLAALLRLRQACCDPRLLGETQVPSAKTEACLEMLQSLAAEGRFTLVFSQFTSMLDILAEQLGELGIEYRLLTGKSQNRAALVADFQAGLAPVFLISLKAGGVGLNLTRADTVIHFDPWWNAAAREQASDRAHRIGQTQPVFVYSLLAEDTVEEKIARLQTAKALLGQQINNSAQETGVNFALKLTDLLNLWQNDEASV